MSSGQHGLTLRRSNSIKKQVSNDKKYENAFLQQGHAQVYGIK